MSEDFFLRVLGWEPIEMSLKRQCISLCLSDINRYCTNKGGNPTIYEVTPSATELIEILLIWKLYLKSRGCIPPTKLI